MLVHLGEGYFVNKNCIQYISPLKEAEIILIGLGDSRIEVPYKLLDEIISVLTK